MKAITPGRFRHVSDGGVVEIDKVYGRGRNRQVHSPQGKGRGWLYGYAKVSWFKRYFVRLEEPNETDLEASPRDGH